MLITIRNNKLKRSEDILSVLFPYSTKAPVSVKAISPFVWLTYLLTLTYMSQFHILYY